MALASIVFIGSESLGTRDHILLSQIWGFPFVASCDSQGGGIRPRLHTGSLSAYFPFSTYRALAIIRTSNETLRSIVLLYHWLLWISYVCFKTQCGPQTEHTREQLSVIICVSIATGMHAYQTIVQQVPILHCLADGHFQVSSQCILCDWIMLISVWLEGTVMWTSNTYR
jgi:hypothetical protein